MLHHKVYQNKLIQVSPDKKLGFFYGIELRKASGFGIKNENATTYKIYHPQQANRLAHRLLVCAVVCS